MQVARPVLAALFAGLLAAGAETTPAKLRPVSLRDCLNAALTHNLDVAIARHTPNIAHFELSAAYGSQYDPMLALTAQRDYADVPSNFDAKKSGVDNPYQQTLDTLGLSLSGRLTPGLAYDVVGSSTADSAFTEFNLPYLPNRYTNTYEAALVFKLRQSLLKDSWIDAGRLRIQINRQNLKLSEQALRLQVMTTVLDVQKAYFDLVYAKENLKVMQAAVTLAEELLDRDRKLVAAERLAPLGEKMAQSQLENAQANRLVAEETLDDKRNALRMLMTANLAEAPREDLDPADVLVAVPEHPDRSEVWQRALTTRPELVQARLELEKQGILVRYSHNQLFPALDLVGSFGGLAVDPRSRGDSLDTIRSFDHPIYGAGIVLKMPLANTAARSQYRASQELKAQALLRLKKLEQTVFVEVDNVVQSLDKIFKRVGAARQARTYAEAALASEQARLDAGATTTFLVNEYERNLVAARTAEILALVDYNKALAQLAFNEGTLLDRHQIKLDFN